MMNLTSILQPQPAPSADDLALAPRADEAKASREFEKVFEKTTAEEAAKQEKKEKTENSEEKSDSKKQAKNGKNIAKTAIKITGQAKDSKAQKKRAEDLTGLGHINAAAVQAQMEPGKKGPKTSAKETQVIPAKTDGKQAGAKQSGESTKQEKGESSANTQKEISNEQAARQALALKRAQIRQAAKAKAKAQVRAEAKAELNEKDEAKAVELRARIAPAKSAKSPAAKLGKAAANAQKSPEPEGKQASGTQFAVNTPNMVMQAKQPAPTPGERPALVEELRPATAAEVGAQSGGQQQDLAREQAKEMPAPIAPVSSAAMPAATGTGAAQAFAPTAGVITPLMEKIWQSVSTFRARGGDEVTVKIQPDNRTEVALTIKYGKGGVEIQARMQQGDGQQLSAGWSELQQALAERGVNLSELSRGENREDNFSENSQNSPKNGEKTAENDGFGFIDEDAEWAALGLDPKSKQDEPEPVRRERAVPAHDGWQSWA